MDQTDWHILGALQQNARLSYTQIGKLVGLTAPAVAERIRKLEDEGVITGYVARVNPAKLGLGITVIIQLRNTRAYHTDVVDRIQTFPEVQEAFLVTGQDDLVLVCCLTGVDHLLRLAGQLSALGEIITSVVLSQPIQRRPLTYDLVQQMLGNEETSS